MSLRENYERVLAEISAAAARVGRNPAEVHLIAVSKTHPVGLVDALAQLGQRDFGENRIAEMAEKQETAQAKNIHWHLIGQLQTNKVKLLTGDVLLHTLDRPSLAEKLQQHFGTRKETIQALIQVNCSGESNKSGVMPEEFDALCSLIAASSAIDVVGLMTMAENTTDERTIRAAFAKLRGLSDKISAQKIFPNFRGMLSMGMSGDFEYAIAEGATHVRVGSAIFGSRPVKGEG